LTDSYFTPFKESIASYSLPESFTFPFYYEPHPLCVLAAKHLQQQLVIQTDRIQGVGMNTEREARDNGKMLGVLLVQNTLGEVGYLSAFSGQFSEQNNGPKFVPPVFDISDENGFFLKGQAEINELNRRIAQLEQNPEIAECDKHLKTERACAKQQIQQHRQVMIEGRKERKAKRATGQDKLDEAEFEHLKIALAKQSVQQKNQLKGLNAHWQQRIEIAEQQLLLLTGEIRALKQQRKEQSKSLQQKVFEHYDFLNINGVKQDLNTLFSNTVQGHPPAGAGDCAAPKLLQYAFSHGLKPLALAEFWWGSPPKSEIRQHGLFYASCQGKCQPILAHMLEGMIIDDNPLLINPAVGKTVDIVYEDDSMVVINKPAGFLSVPGKNIEDSIYSRMAQQYPNATGPLIVHRLDMSTSGLMVIALTKQAHQRLQQQFIQRTVKKRYIALLEGELEADEGVIDLPLRVDLEDRPRQLVCYDYGKPAQTYWQVITRHHSQTKVYFYPITGRTHQLRVHSAHVKGLNMPIRGDDLYGRASNRLHLHAESLEIAHPMTQQSMHFQVDALF
jgi:tRNA pseudouridine32 synthase/23S rRNA pseudouridine746 synthase